MMKKLIAVTASAMLTFSAISVSAANIKQDTTSLSDNSACTLKDCSHTKEKSCMALELLDKLIKGEDIIPDFNSDGYKDLLKDLFDQIIGDGNEENETPETDNPVIPESPEEKPEEDKPEITPPEWEKPETDIPETEIPDSESPDTEVPENNKPEASPDGGNGFESDSEYINEVLRLVNKYRAENGLKALTLDKSLCSAADIRAKEIKTSFSHTRPNGSSCFTVLSELGISYGGAGENIAYGQTSPEEVMTAWMNSSGHRANILSSSYTKLGVGVYSSGGTLYWAQMFTY